MTDRFNKAVDDIERRTTEMKCDIGEESAFNPYEKEISEIREEFMKACLKAERAIAECRKYQVLSEEQRKRAERAERKLDELRKERDGKQISNCPR